MMTQVKLFFQEFLQFNHNLQETAGSSMSARRSGVVNNKLPTAHLNSVTCLDLPNDWDKNFINILN